MQIYISKWQNAGSERIESYVPTFTVFLTLVGRTPYRFLHKIKAGSGNGVVATSKYIVGPAVF